MPKSKEYLSSSEDSESGSDVSIHVGFRLPMRLGLFLSVKAKIRIQFQF